MLSKKTILKSVMVVLTSVTTQSLAFAGGHAGGGQMSMGSHSMPNAIHQSNLNSTQMVHSIRTTLPVNSGANNVGVNVNSQPVNAGGVTNTSGTTASSGLGGINRFPSPNGIHQVLGSGTQTSNSGSGASGLIGKYPLPNGIHQILGSGTQNSNPGSNLGGAIGKYPLPNGIHQILGNGNSTGSGPTNPNPNPGSGGNCGWGCGKYGCGFGGYGWFLPIYGYGFGSGCGYGYGCANYGSNYGGCCSSGYAYGDSAYYPSYLSSVNYVQPVVASVVQRPLVQTAQVLETVTTSSPISLPSLSAVPVSLAQNSTFVPPSPR